VYGPVRTDSAPFDVVLIAGSLGAVKLHRTVLEALPPDLPAAVVVVQHRRPGADGLTELLGRAAALPVADLPERGRLERGTVSVASPRRQATFLAPFTVDSTPVPDARPPRPRADPLMVSAARHHGARTLAVVLSGRLDDGAAGARAVKLAGGQVIAQSPDTAYAPGMPGATLATGCVDLALAPERIGPAIAVLCGVPGAAALFRGRPASWALNAAL
jgi:two-component system chemotaxis response regulator CheB